MKSNFTFLQNLKMLKIFLKICRHFLLFLTWFFEILFRMKCSFLESGTSLLGSLKQKVVELASNSGVLETVQKAAQSCLQAGWSILLPTAEERARALSTLTNPT